MRKSNGFSVAELLIVVIVVVIIGALGVVGYNSWKNNGAKQADTSNKTATTSIPEVKTTSDLDTVSKLLDDTDLNETAADSQKLGNESAAF